jgi:hypothetical protein
VPSHRNRNFTVCARCGFHTRCIDLRFSQRHVLLPHFFRLFFLFSFFFFPNQPQSPVEYSQYLSSEDGVEDQIHDRPFDTEYLYFVKGEILPIYITTHTAKLDKQAPAQEFDPSGQTPSSRVLMSDSHAGGEY